ncbi:unnamed protein product [Caenorhabditis auriculariae]|uniref:Saposin B-type domain-containing protein n=1 Tax=Caenorhabditis auriculariae TaxID=2777116 RepID=A0A8S1HD45_9PELO|nr:unnamed protein product [Caenorhabditis auriculariae]
MQKIAILLVLAVGASAFVMPKRHIQKPEVAAGVGCIMCELMVELAKDPADRDAKKIEATWNAECKAEFGKLPFIEKDCEKYADQKLDVIIKELESGTAPEEVCTKIGEC